MQVPSFRTINAVHLGLWHGHERLLNKVPFHHCWWCPVSHRSSVSREIVCSRPRMLREAIRDLLLFMPMEEPRQVWNDLLPRLHLKGGFLWRLLCSALWINRLCGQVLGFAQLSAPPSTSGCYLPCFRKERNCSCSRVGNIGMQPASRTLPCPNGLLELMWNMDPMGVALLPFWSRTSTVKRQRISIKLSTYIPWKTWRSKALTPRSSASWRSESSPMSIPWKPSLQFIFSRLQGICRTSSPMTSGLRR